MKFLADMGISPRVVEELRQKGHGAVHLLDEGLYRMNDGEILEKARRENCVLLTHDLDFGAILAATQAIGPSVIQIRADNVMPEDAGDTVIAAIRRFQDALEQGALISVDPQRARARILPLDR